MRSDRSVDIELGGEVRRLRYSVQALEELEALLPGMPGGVLDLMRLDVWPISYTVSAVLCGLKWENRTLRRETVQGWVAEYCRNNPQGLDFLHVKAAAAIGYSGMVGDASAFDEVLNLIQGDEDDDNEKK